MPSIINGLFSGRSGLSSHGTAISVVGDNISNSSTVGYKSSRAEFEDFIAGGQSAGKVIGSGSNLSAVTTVFQQGTLEATGRPLDLAVDGNGFFVVASGAQRFFTRAGNFKVSNAGFIEDQGGFSVLGFPSNGSGALEPINVNAVSDNNSTATTGVSISGNLDASATSVNLTTFDTANPVSAPGTTTSTTTYATINGSAEFSTVVDVFDSLGTKHTVTNFFFKTDNPSGAPSAAVTTYIARSYVNSEDVDGGSSPTSGLPRQISGEATLYFDSSGRRIDSTGAPITTAPTSDLAASFNWNNGTAASFNVKYYPFTGFAASSGIQSISQDGKGVGAVTSLSIESDGKVFALLDNGQRSELGRVGLVNFSNPEGLNRVGKNLLQQTTSSGEPIVGRPGSGTFGQVKSGSLELSTVDVASEFVKLITLQRGFQANSRIITTINQLLQEIIQLA